MQRGAQIPSQPLALRESQNADTQSDGEANLNNYHNAEWSFVFCIFLSVVGGRDRRAEVW